CNARSFRLLDGAATCCTRASSRDDGSSGELHRVAPECATTSELILCAVEETEFRVLFIRLNELTGDLM
ncbi:unnamed protein product, partial [Amoebophrya sp. A25]